MSTASPVQNDTLLGQYIIEPVRYGVSANESHETQHSDHHCCCILEAYHMEAGREGIAFTGLCSSWRRLQDDHF